MTTSFISETIDQELTLEEMEDVNGGTFGAGVVVGALAVLVIKGIIDAEREGTPGSTKSAFGRKSTKKDADEETAGDSDGTEDESGFVPVPGGGDPTAHY